MFQGATIIEDKTSGAILVKRILEESPIAACNKVHAGDELTRYNSFRKENNYEDADNNFRYRFYRYSAA